MTPSALVRDQENVDVYLQESPGAIVEEWDFIDDEEEDDDEGWEYDEE